MEETKKQDVNSLLTQKMIENRTILIYGGINQDLAKEVSSQLLLLASLSDDPITGWVASAGITIFLAANKKNRYSLPNTRFMIHQPAGGVQGQSTEIQIEAREIVKMRERVNRLIAKATGQTYEKVAEDTDRNYWMTAEEAVQYGIASKIIKASKQVK
jgi:ATP-dependent Clp protease protease subunit